MRDDNHLSDIIEELTLSLQEARATRRLTAKEEKELLQLRALLNSAAPLSAAEIKALFEEEIAKGPGPMLLLDKNGGQG